MIVDLEITPFTGVGPISFGMSAEDVRQYLGGDFKQFRKTPNATVLSDHFRSHGIVVYYSPEMKVKALEFGGQAQPLWQGKRLLGCDAAMTFKLMKEVSADYEMDENGVIYHDIGFGWYAPGWLDAQSEPIIGVIVFQRGYYKTRADR